MAVGADMGRICLTLALVSTVAGLSAGAANAQGACSASGVLSSVQGTVLVNRGAGFVPAAPGSSIPGGTQVSVQGAGRAVVDFSGNMVTVPASTTVAVRPPGCATASATVGQVFVTTAIVGSVIGTAIAVNDNGGTRIPISP
ncbi:conserved hypothetical protein [Ancylobacter novellus DSM 506]|uniref:IPT/TIG domain-containing protein n=2 Tax=Ancylobacter novellus TaxID=921 RepID=D7AAU5_ANCN5|nr:conserved hypothetical protein [Ancylobacter novellus DSM 506]